MTRVFIGASGAVIGDLNEDRIVEVVSTTYSVVHNISNQTILDKNGIQLQ